MIEESQGKQSMSRRKVVASSLPYILKTWESVSVRCAAHQSSLHRLLRPGQMGDKRAKEHGSRNRVGPIQE